MDETELRERQSEVTLPHAGGSAAEPEVDPSIFHEQSLPRCDGGWAAWRLLMAAFVFEALLWGVLNSVGSLWTADTFRFPTQFRSISGIL